MKPLIVPVLLLGTILAPSFMTAATNRPNAAGTDKAVAQQGSKTQPGNCGAPKPAKKAHYKRHVASAVRKVTPTGRQSQAQTTNPFVAPALPTLAAAPITPVKPAEPVSLFEPRITNPPFTSNLVTEVQLRPLFVTTVRLPEPVTSIAVGAPTLFTAEHSDDDPRLVFIKPTTHDKVESNLLIALQSGNMVSLKLMSSGDDGTTPALDYILDYHQPRSLFAISGTPNSPLNSAAISSDPAPSDPVHSKKGALPPKTISETNVNDSTPHSIDDALSRQAAVPAPVWLKASDLKNAIKSNAKAPETIAVSIGSVIQNGDTMTVTYSVLNISNQWVQVLPPQIQLANPTQTKPSKKHQVLADQVPIKDYRLSGMKLAPGQREDGAVQFSRPGFKQTQDSLLLQIATASAVDTPLLMPLPFVAPGQ